MSKTLQLETVHHMGEAAKSTMDGPTQGGVLLEYLFQSGVAHHEDWDALENTLREELNLAATVDVLLPLLIEAQLLTEYQAAQVAKGNSHFLVLGNYRILDRVGAGGMGVVYRGEHRLLRRPVAIKVLQSSACDEPIVLQRFFTEMRVLARIRHNNIVCALDAGTCKSTTHDAGDVHYLVMEHVKGANLEQLVAQAPLSIAQACDLTYQIAAALDETHKHNLIHRDIKPSNLLLAPDGTAKLVDFGLTLFSGQRRMTAPGTLLGTLSFMAPEQVSDAATVDIRADIYGLGATLYFCLAGAAPFAGQGHLAHQVNSRLSQAPPPELCKTRYDVPTDLEAIMRRMMAHKPEDRYPTPQSVMRALLPYVNAPSRFRPQQRPMEAAAGVKANGQTPAAVAATVAAAPRILIIDDETLVRNLCKSFFKRDRFECHEACDGIDGLHVAATRPFDLVLLDIDMPRLTGTETLRRLRQRPPCNNLKIIMMSGGVTADEMAELLAMGADDYLTKPLNRHELVARTRTALLHKATEDRFDALNQELLRLNAELEQSLTARSSDLTNVRSALVFGLAKIVESRSDETSDHLTRMALYARSLVEQARRQPRFEKVLDDAFQKTLESCTTLHDIGNVALPDHIVRKSAALDSEDLLIMQSHTTIGAETLKSVAKRDRMGAGFWQMAIDIARHHHERFDGVGYPDRLSGSDIPLPARIVALADAYDALRTSGASGTELSHNAAVALIAEGSRGRFDPQMVEAFLGCEAEFDHIYRSNPKTAP
jgi:response regulator RpfG family c-di-GMP phosphodiesterase/tRNA A-37 threonylcarbamoyl transferase component Bud32